MKEKLETSIFVDGDACPVKDEILKVAYRHKVPVFMVSNQWMRIEVGPLVKKVVVSAGPDEADDWIADRVGQNDIAITADIPLAKRCLEAGAIVLGMTGRLFSSDNIGMALAMRELKAQLRETGESRGYNAAFTKADRSKFLQELDRQIILHSKNR